MNRFLFGVTYYPEHWPADGHARDLDRIAAAGFNVVRLGEGAWWYWEPREGQYQFELFDRVIDLCRERNIKVILGTPTYCGPAWIAQKYPEVLRWHFERQPMRHGSRRFYNYTSPKYLELSDRICTALAEHYAKDDQVISWQLDNEFNCHMDVSYAPSDTIAFRAWLREKYGTLDALNDAWGARFWSQVYDDWEQVDLPAPTATYHNPTQLLDESRFVSDCVVRFAKRQADILRAANPRWQITHNGLFGNVNGPKLAKLLDYFSHDHYPLFWRHWWEFCQKLIEARSLSFPFAIMEQQAGPGGQMTYLHRTPQPGEMRLWTYQSIAHGADKLLYFTWRTCPFGSEQHWHGLIEADGRDTDRLAEAAGVANELATLPDDYFDARPIKVAAVLRDFDVDVNEKRINTYPHEGRWAYGRWAAGFARQHVPVDFAWSSDAFDGYQMLIACHQKLVEPALVEKFQRFVDSGGTLVLGAQSGLHDRNLHIVQQTPPGLLAELAGVEVESFTTLAKGETRRLTFAKEPGYTGDAIAFAERLRPTTAEPIAWWETDDRLLSGGVAATIRYVGKGRVVYLGGYLDDNTIAKHIERRIKQGHLKPTIDAPDSVEWTVRDSGPRRYLTLLNHGDQPATVDRLPPHATALLGPSPEMASLTLEPYGVAILTASR